VSLLAQGGQSPLALTLVLAARGLAGVAVLAAASALAERQVRRVAIAAGLAGAVSAIIGSALPSGQ